MISNKSICFEVRQTHISYSNTTLDGLSQFESIYLHIHHSHQSMYSWAVPLTVSARVLRVPPWGQAGEPIWGSSVRIGEENKSPEFVSTGEQATDTGQHQKPPPVPTKGMNLKQWSFTHSDMKRTERDGADGWEKTHTHTHTESFETDIWSNLNV